MATVSPVIDPVLARLAGRHGVATWYEDWRRRRVDVAPDVVVAVLGLLGVDAATPAAARAALSDVDRDPAFNRGALVQRQGQRATVGRGGVLILADGRQRPVSGSLPADLPLGYHCLVDGDTETPVIVTPPRLADARRSWGWMLQLYALHSADSWGMGDFGDLADAARRAAAGGASFMLLNPLHAVTPGDRVPASPYSPSSRRFVNPLYLRVSDVPGYAARHEEIDALRPPSGGKLIDYDAVWRAKRAALELLAPRTPEAGLGPALRDFATYNALAERHGPDWRRWPVALRRPDSPAVDAARVDLADRVAFHAWLQRQCTEQLAAAGRAGAGMELGIVHDLAVGVDPGGADGWLLQDVLADGVRIGAPPDSFNQLGQDWGLATWRPDRLAATGYRAYRELVSAVLGYAGGIRVDHVAGLWRLWWVPPGASADQGTYVHYDPEAMVGILALEAHLAGAVVIGEDLGTVQPVVTRELSSRNMLGSSVLWFARETAGDPAQGSAGDPVGDDPTDPTATSGSGGSGGDPSDTPRFLASAQWPVEALGTISTHDLPTATGFLTGEHVRVRARLGVLARGEAEERADALVERAALVALLRTEGLVGADPTDEQIVDAMHAFLAATPCRLVAVSPYDVIGEIRQPNLPGTVDEYPNWRLPLPLRLEDLFDDPRVRHVTAVMNTHRPQR